MGVDTLEVIATAAPRDVEALWVAIDAQRQDVVCGLFRRAESGVLSPVAAPRLIGVDQWLRALEPEAVVAGPVLRKLIGRLPDHVTALEPRYWAPTAGAVARLADRLHAAGHRDDLWRLAPRYFRKSAAEEKWKRQHGPDRRE